MKVTSPKNTAFKGTQTRNFNQTRFTIKKELGLNTRESFQSYCTTKRISINQDNEEYGPIEKQSNFTQQILNKSGRSKSKIGISMSRDKTIKVDNIYQPQDFGETNKNSQYFSTKSLNSKNTKNLSRTTLATNPTITHFPEERQQISTQSIPFNSIKQFNLSISKSEPDSFDFNDLKRQINKMDQMSKMSQHINHNFKPFTKPQQYYNDKIYEPKETSSRNSNPNKQALTNIDNISQSEYNTANKSHKIDSHKKIRQHSMQSYYNLKNQQIASPYQDLELREKSSSKIVKICKNSASSKVVYAQKQLPSNESYHTKQTGKMLQKNYMSSQKNSFIFSLQY